MNGIKIFNHDSSFVGQVGHNDDVVFFNNSKIVDAIASGLAVEGSGTSFPTPQSNPPRPRVGQLYWFAGSGNLGASLAVYHGGAGTDYPGVANSEGWYRVGRYELPNNVVLTDGSRPFTGPQVGVNATNDDHLVTLGQVKAYLSGFKVTNVKCVISAANINLSGIPSPSESDGVSLQSDDYVLVWNQTNNPQQNGIYVVKTGAWQRRQEFDTWDELLSVLVIVQEGSAYNDTVWISTIAPGGTLGTDPVTFTIFPTGATYNAENIGNVPSGITYGNIYARKTGNNTFQFRRLAGSNTIIVDQNGDVVYLIVNNTEIRKIAGYLMTADVGPLVAGQAYEINHLYGNPHLIVQFRDKTTGEYLEFDYSTTSSKIFVYPIRNEPADKYEAVIYGTPTA